MDLSPRSRYWHAAGFNVSGCVSWVVAFIVGYLLVTARVSADEVWFSGPLAGTFIGKNGLAWLVTMLLAAGIYAAWAALARRSSYGARTAFRSSYY